MSKSRVIVLSVVHQGLSKREAAEKYGVTVRWVNVLLQRFGEGGLDAIQPRSRRPHRNPRAIGGDVRERVIELRGELLTQGFDAGPISIAWALESEGSIVPAVSTIRRILLSENLITAQPRKRPRTSFIRFQVHQPNETW